MWVVKCLCLVFRVYDNLVFLRMPVAQSRLANGFGAFPLWPDVHKMFFGFPVIWCCTNVEMSCLGLDCGVSCFCLQKQALFFSVVWAEEEKHIFKV